MNKNLKILFCEQNIRVVQGLQHFFSQKDVEIQNVIVEDEIKENEYNLNIPRYVDTFEEEEIDVLDYDDGTDVKHQLNLVYDNDNEVYSFDDVTSVVVKRGTNEEFFEKNNFIFRRKKQIHHWIYYLLVLAWKMVI